jgi:hypothetical protein
VNPNNSTKPTWLRHPAYFRCKPSMRLVIFIGSFLALVVLARAAPQEYPREVSQWREMSIPPETDKVARAMWFYAANNSTLNWRVFVENGQVCARLTNAKPQEQHDHPKFTPAVAGQFLGLPSAFARVSDGWLVGFNQGEFGGALHWFSADGKRKYKISDDQVIDFFNRPDGLYAIQGLDHLGMSKGSIIQIAKSVMGARWQVSTTLNLPFAPYAISVRRDHTLFVTLSDSLVSIGPENKINTLLPDAPWIGLYPNSSVLSQDQQKLYIGLRQFVGEFDIPTKKLRLLIPSDAFLNRLSKEQEQQIRQPFGG